MNHADGRHCVCGSFPELVGVLPQRNHWRPRFFFFFPPFFLLLLLAFGGVYADFLLQRSPRALVSDLGASLLTGTEALAQVQGNRNIIFRPKKNM